MKIVNVECHLLTCQQRFSSSGKVYTSSSALVRIVTDENLDGLADPLAGYHCPEAIPAIVEFYKKELMGEDPLRISHLWRKMHSASLFWGRSGPGLSVLGALDNALWDIKAKSLGVPLYDLLGGLANERLHVYATGASAVRPLEKTVEVVMGYVAEGFTAFKMGTGMMFGLHVAFARHTCELIEILPLRTELQKATLAEPLRFEKGHLLPPTSPGDGLVWHDHLPRQFQFIPGSGERQGEG
jgi:L-alanine-DL-glutamate epimerase-like enolase superfamily enzyme